MSEEKKYYSVVSEGVNFDVVGDGYEILDGVLVVFNGEFEKPETVVFLAAFKIWSSIIINPS